MNDQVHRWHGKREPLPLSAIATAQREWVFPPSLNEALLWRNILTSDYYTAGEPNNKH